MAALIAGKVDAIPTFPPYNYDLVDKGYNLIGDEATYGNYKEYLTTPP